MKAPSVTKLVAVAALVGSMGLAASAAGAGQSTPGSRAMTPAAKAATKSVAFHATYHGTMSLLWASTSVSVTSLTGTGAAPLLGASTLKGTGTSSPSSTCDPFGGKGTITSAKGTIIFSVVSSAKQSACAAGSAAPTAVTVKGVATVLNGTGAYLGAKGSLAISGSFSIQSTSAGTSETDSFTATLSGKLTVK